MRQYPPNRRVFLGATAAAGICAALGRASGGEGPEGEDVDLSSTVQARPTRPLLTPAEDFVDVSRGNPKPHSLRGEALAKAGLTPETWRLEVVGDGSSDLARPLRAEDGSAITFEALEELGKSRGVAYLKAMQCNNIPSPLGQGLWEGVPLSEVVRLAGKAGNVRRVYYSGFHNHDPAQLFQSSLAFNRVMETPPTEPPPIVAYRLNGEPIPLKRGGPVRMVVPWAHGFKSIKWLQQIVLTNDYKANDTYALQNNDPESFLKTAAYPPKGPLAFKAGEPVLIEGTAMVGWSGLQRVESWVRLSPDDPKDLDDGDPAWKSAEWRSCDLAPPPGDWWTLLPEGVSPGKIWGFDPKTGKPKNWPLPFSMVPWTASLGELGPGTYEFRARTIDLNGYAQPEPRTYQKSGMNRIARLKLVIAS